jgi:hypothetical protein
MVCRQDVISLASRGFRMDDETDNTVSPGPNAEAQTDSEPPSLLFGAFLESVPPGQLRRINNFRGVHFDSVKGKKIAYVSLPQVVLYCASDECNGDRVFRASAGRMELPPVGGIQDKVVYYRCSNCERSLKTFALRMVFRRDEEVGECIKFGEFPPFGPPTPTRLLRMFGTDRDIFLKGRRCENQGLGIGAFSYYRRIVESHKNQIFDEVIRVAKKVAPGMVETFECAKSENHFFEGYRVR